MLLILQNFAHLNLLFDKKCKQGWQEISRYENLQGLASKYYILQPTTVLLIIATGKMIWNV
jgi:hypothetical protein